MMNSYIAKSIQVAALLAFLLSVGSVRAQESPPKRTVGVSGEGIVRIEPDMADVHFGIASVADDPETARQMNAEASAAAMNAVRALGVEDRYIRLENLRLQPHRVWVDDRRRYEEQGYEAIRTVVVEVHDLDRLPVIVAEIVEKGANRLERVAYDVRDRDRARNDALREAVMNAREKAQLVAQTLDEQLGRVQTVNEQSFDFPQPVMRMESLQMDQKAAAPEPDAYAAGELEVRASVHVTFELE